MENSSSFGLGNGNKTVSESLISFFNTKLIHIHLCRRQKEVSQDNFQPKYESYILLKTRLDSAYQASVFLFLSAFLLFWVSEFRALFMKLTNLFFNKIFIKNESHDIIHTFKNYFSIMFLIFNF